AIVSVNSTRLLCKSLFYLATLKVEFNFSLQLLKIYKKMVLTTLSAWCYTVGADKEMTGL
ncbi:hypothetical protein KSU88_07340, partial [[Clostridium] innocuum]|uniref:hypothetical protein n=1 Tax=Clostridium innocuum TaxID=1522 RepID=UPI001C394FB2